MRVYLLRHGIAESPGFGMPDEQRALTDEGNRRLRAAVGAFRRCMADIDRVLCSPFRRARESAAILTEGLGYSESVEIQPELQPGGDPARVLELINALHHEGARGVALVSHEPLAGRLLGALTTGTRASIPFDTGMLACVALASPTTTIGALEMVLRQDDAARF